ncbi:MAG: FAD-containing oxidoreductase [Balneolaceae bacterium]|nr:FAD-containing oxidoreductase [Balneolaceae bacterium]
MFDAIIIGIGQAGPALAARCASEGLNTAIIERHKFGGTCVNTGCTPTKAMVASARAAHMARRGDEFGVEIDGDIRVDFKKVQARKDRLVKESSEGVESWLKKTENLTVIEGHARFVDNHTITVNDQQLKAEKIFINVGGRAFIPSGFDSVDYLTNASVMDLDTLPDHLIIVGGSYVGLEFGQMFRRFGSKVTIIERGPRLIGKEDEEISNAIHDMLQEEGIQFRFNAECIGASGEGNDITVNIDCEQGPPTVTGSHLLLATGRQPNTDDLGLENTDIETDENGFIKTDDVLKTDAEHIWALGDCNGKGAFTHTAYNDFEIVAANLFNNDPRKVSDRILCYALYTDPPLARIGMNEEQARQSGRNILVGYREMARIARAKERSEKTGFIRILVDADTDKILGATIFGINGDEIIHSLLDVMYADKPYTVISRAIHIHPTISELIPTILQNLEPLDES